MTNKEKQDWLKYKYPLTIITDRYSGTYSDGYYLAFPLDFDEIPSAVNDSDPECAEFWKDYLEPVGKGSSVQAAIDDLIYKMHKQTESEDERMIKWLHYLIEIAYTTDLAWDISKDDTLAWLEKQKEQKPAEYLDKDKVYAIMTKLTNLSYSQLIPINSNEYKKIDEITSDVRDLLDYPIEQKSSWSEEDRRTIDRACVALRAYANGELPDILPSEILEYADKLQSLRPSWKPSEEQMKALQCAIVFMEIGKASDYDITPLKLLYEHLKKLM